MIRRGERGAAILWGILVTIVVGSAVLVVAGTLTRRGQSARHMQAAEAAADLREAGRTWARHQLRRDSGWTGPDTIQLAGGEVTVRVVRERGERMVELSVRARGASGERTVRLKP